MMRHEFKRLIVWQDARELNKLIYQLTSNFPNEEKYGLVSQMRRSSVSIASNISEGSSYSTDKMFLKFLDIALGSICELETQLYLSSDVSFIDEKNLILFTEKINVLKRKLLAFMQKLKTN